MKWSNSFDLFLLIIFFKNKSSKTDKTVMDKPLKLQGKEAFETDLKKLNVALEKET